MIDHEFLVIAACLIANGLFTALAGVAAGIKIAHIMQERP